jgi:2-oxoglutarate dehydrogenase E1 component
VAVSDEQMKRAVLDSIRALMLIRAYRIRGHLVADLDPLGMRDQTPHPELDPKSYGFTERRHGPADLHRQRAGAADRVDPRDLAIVKRTYCGTFALQYMHISDPEQAGWLKERIEGYGKEVASPARAARRS